MQVIKIPLILNQIFPCIYIREKPKIILSSAKVELEKIKIKKNNIIFLIE